MIWALWVFCLGAVAAFLFILPNSQSVSPLSIEELHVQADEEASAQPTLNESVVVGRTASTETLQNPDGSFTRSIYAGRVFVGNKTTGFVPFNATLFSIIPTTQPLFNYELNQSYAPGFQVYFKSNPTQGQVVKYVVNGTEITFQPMALNYRNDLSQIQQVAMVQAVTGAPSVNSFLYPGAYGPGIDLKYTNYINTLKEEIVIDSFSRLPVPAAYILSGANPTLDLAFDLGIGAKMIIDGIEWDKSSDKTTSNAVEIQNMSGKTLYTLPAPIITDASGNQIAGKYSFKKSGKNLYVIIKTNYTWLSQAVYPVTIDPTLELQDADTENFKDAYVRSDNPNTNYGTSTALAVKNDEYRTYIQFNLSSLYSNTNTRNILLANLSFYAGGSCSTTSNSKLNIYHVYNWINGTGGGNLNETQLTWNNQPCGVNFDNNTNCNLTTQDTYTGFWCDQWISFNVTASLNDSFNNNYNNISFIIKNGSYNLNDRWYPYSKESVSVAYIPKLVITYTPYIDILSPSNSQIFTQDNPTAIFNITTSVPMDACYWNYGGANYTLTPNGSNTAFGVVNDTMDDGGYTNIKFYCNQSSDGIWISTSNSPINITIDSKNVTECRNLVVPRTYDLINDISADPTGSHNCLYFANSSIALDCHNYKINTQLYAFDIQAQNNITIKNCNLNSSLVGIWIEQGDNVTIINTTINITNSSSWDIYQKSGITTHVTSLNVSYVGNNANHENISSASSKLYRKWYLNAYVNNTLKQPLQSASVVVYNATSSVSSSSTGANGLSAGNEITEYTLSGGTYIFQTPHKINVSKEGYLTNSTSVNFSSSQNTNHHVLLTPILTIDITSPTQVYSTNTSLNLNFTITNYTAIDKCWFYVLNSSGSYDTSNTTISDCLNVTFNVSREGVYTIYAFVNTTATESAFDSSVFEVSLTGPAVVLNYPSNATYLNHTENIYFNYTSTDPNGLSACQLWSDFTGSWHNNYTWIQPNNQTMNFTTQNISDGSYLWNIWCNDTLNNGKYGLNNLSFVVDTIYPIITLSTITTTAGSQTISFTSAVTELNPNTCKYSIFNSSGGIDGLSSNISFACGSPGSATVTAYGTYNLTVYALDLAGWENSSTMEFTTSASSGGTVTGGGGGGDEVVIVIGGNFSWTMRTEGGGRKYDFSMKEGELRTKGIVFSNLEDLAVDIAVSCVDVAGQLCQYVNLSSTKVSLAATSQDEKTITFTLKLPDTLEPGTYDFKIVGKANDLGEGSISVRVRIGGFFNSIIAKFVGKTQIGAVSVYNFLFIALILGVVFPVCFMIFRNNKSRSFISLAITLGAIVVLMVFI